MLRRKNVGARIGYLKATLVAVETEAKCSNEQRQWTESLGSPTRDHKDGPHALSPTSSHRDQQGYLRQVIRALSS